MFEKWGKRLGVGLLYSCAPLLFAGAPDQLATRSDESKYPPPGQMVDVGGYKLHLHSTGSGDPAVIIDAGLGGVSSDWSLVQAEIAKFTQVVSYDRAGIAWSEPSPFPRTSQQIVQELHTLLEHANIPKPYILVGHSFGGINVQLYAISYPDEVVGMVLVDSSNETGEENLPPHPIYDLAVLKKSSEDLKFKSTSGMACFITQMFIKSMMTSLPESMQKTHLALCSTPKHYEAVSAEWSSSLESFRQLANADRSLIKNKPCFVLSAGCEADLSKCGATVEQQKTMNGKIEAWQIAWNTLQKDLASKFNQPRHIIAEKSDHMLHWKQPEMIVQAVKQLVEENKQ